MTLQQRINKWLINIKKYIVLYKDGYYVVPYLSNSPDVMINSLKSMPFTKHFENENAIHTSNIFTDGTLYYREITEGLWVIITEIKFLKNVCIKALHDNEPSEYFFLSYINYNVQVGSNTVNDLHFPKVGWSLYKPGTEITGYYNKGDEGIFANIVFTKSWVDKNIPTNQFSDENSFKNYLTTNKTYMIWDDFVPNAYAMVSNLLRLLKSSISTNTYNLDLTILCLNLINGFVNNASQEVLNKDFLSIKESDRVQLIKAEKLLIDALTTAFPGIDAIAKAVHISPTKLKASFKIVYNKTMFQYYQEKQMEIAMDLLKNKQQSVKQVATALGYESQTNFTVAFKKVYNMLPSEVGD